MKAWVYALIAGLATLVVVAGVGGYVLGIRTGRASANAVRNRFLAERLGAQGQGGARGLAGGVWPGMGADRAGTSGTVKSVEGQTVVVTTRNGDVKVQMTDKTTVRKQADATLEDVQPGLRIVVAGEADSSGTVTADSIQLAPVER